MAKTEVRSAAAKGTIQPFPERIPDRHRKCWVRVTARRDGIEADYFLDPSLVAGLGPPTKYTHERDDISFRTVFLQGGQFEMLNTPDNVQKIMAPEEMDFTEVHDRFHNTLASARKQA